MTTIGYAFILIALLLIRQVSRGRVMNMGEDLTDAFIAVVNGQPDSLTAVLARTGESNTPTLPVENANNTAPKNSTGLAAITVGIGSQAKGYRWAATGPDYYDCSGLMWRACQKLGYTGPRFFTATVASMPGFKKVDQGAVNDIVLWPGHHMGVITAPNQFYSARNPKAGIGYASITGFRPEAPVYLRYGG